MHLKEKIKNLEKICADQKSELGTCHRKLNCQKINNLKSQVPIEYSIDGFQNFMSLQKGDDNC